MTASERFEMRVDPKDRAKWEKVAKLDGRTLASWLTVIANREVSAYWEKVEAEIRAKFPDWKVRRALRKKAVDLPNDAIPQILLETKRVHLAVNDRIRKMSSPKKKSSSRAPRR